jgi:hypothetical protein
MLPIHIGLVPADGEVVDEPELLFRVAAALQMQLTRDFEPVWQTPAVLSAFTSLDQLPPACLPLVIVRAGTLGTGDHAFHTTEKGTPIGLVEWADEGAWSLAASHELLEMVCDPEGKRKVMAESLADLEPGSVEEDNEDYLTQGRVAYLLEICDPCQNESYSLNGFQVSDFVVPRYYAPHETQCGCYSFTGAVKRPLDICNGGYITWYTSIDKSPVWQAKRGQPAGKELRGKLSIGPMTIPVPGSSRSDVDFSNDLFDNLGAAVSPGPAPPPPGAGARDAKNYGEVLREDLERVLQDVSQATVDVGKVLVLIKKLATNEDYWNDFNDDKTFRSKELTDQLGLHVSYPGEVPSREQLSAVHAKAVQASLPAGGKVPPKAAATMMLGQT